MCICELQGMDRIKDPPFSHLYPLKGQQAYTIINDLCICEHNSEGDRYGVDSSLSNATFTIKGQQAYTIINVCVFVNTIQKEMDME